MASIDDELKHGKGGLSRWSGFRWFTCVMLLFFLVVNVSFAVRYSNERSAPNQCGTDPVCGFFLGGPNPGLVALAWAIVDGLLLIVWGAAWVVVARIVRPRRARSGAADRRRSSARTRRGASILIAALGLLVAVKLKPAYPGCATGNVRHWQGRAYCLSDSQFNGIYRYQVYESGGLVLLDLASNAIVAGPIPPMHPDRRLGWKVAIASAGFIASIALLGWAKRAEEQVAK